MAVDLQDFSRRFSSRQPALDQYGASPGPVRAAGARAHRVAADGGEVRGGPRGASGDLQGPPEAHAGGLSGRGAIFLPENARFSRLLALPETADLAEELNAAMKAIADANPDLAGVIAPGLCGPAERRAAGAAAASRAAEDRRRRLRPDLRVLHGPVRLGLHAEGRRVLHARFHREAHRRDHRALSRHDLRPGLRLGRHVRALGGVRPAPPQDRPPRRSASTASRRCPTRCASAA